MAAKNGTLAVWEKLKPLIDAEIAQQTRSCCRMVQMVVATPYNAETKTVGVREAFGDIINIPVSGSVDTSKLEKGTSVWVVVPFSSYSNAVVLMLGDGDTGYAANAGKLGGKAPSYYTSPPDLTDNGAFRINQRKVTVTTAWQYCFDRWIARLSDITLSVTDNGLRISSNGTSNVFLYQKLNVPVTELLGKPYTVAVCDGDGNIACQSIVLPQTEPTAWTTYATARVGGAFASIIHTGADENGFSVSVGRSANSTGDVVIAWVALYPGTYDLDTLPEHQFKPKIVDLETCLQFFRIYATAGARPSNGLDCSPPMRLANPTQGTLEIDGQTYYFNDADL